MEQQGQQLATQQKQLTTKTLFERIDVRKKFEEMLGKKAQGFMTSVLQVVASNEMLKSAEPTSVYQAAATAATLDLPINNNLGFAYIVPYKTKIKGTDGQPDRWATVAQFQMGYKGFKQLAIRSGQFQRLNATDVREGEIKKHDRLSGDIEFQWIDDQEARAKTKIVAYVSFFKLANGFQQTFLMYLPEVTAHAMKYSQTFKKGYGLWKDDFEGMALKTVTKLNLSKNAPLSIEMQRAVLSDQAVIKDVDTNDVEYVDADAEVIKPEAIAAQKEADRIRDFIAGATTIEQLDSVYEHVTDDLMDDFLARKEQLSKAA